MIFQDPMTSLNPLLRIGDQLIETIRRHSNLSEKEASEKAIALLNDVRIPDPGARINHYPHQMSGGMRQRVVITLALCAEPELIIADEPTTALDVSVQGQILALLKELCKARNIGVILITHDIGVISEIADRVAVMQNGRIVEVGDTEQVITKPKAPYTASLMAAVPRPDVKLHRFPDECNDANADSGKIKKIDVRMHWLGKESFTSQDSQGNSPLLEVKQLTKRFVTRRSIIPSWRRTFTAVKDATFDVFRGETLGLVGESGSGKSTIARLIAGLYPVTEGCIIYNGHELSGQKPAKNQSLVGKQIQMIFQDPYSSLNRRMRIRDIVAEPIRHHKLASSEFEVLQIVQDLLEYVRVGAAAYERYPHEFSGGQRQRISIARALATRPRFLICDEPTSALDVSVQAQVLNLLKDLQSELGLTMLFISHDLPVVRQMCDRILVMRSGNILETAPTEKLFEAPEHEYTKSLLENMPKMLNVKQAAG